jgi:rsbT co-antagonist protein RsbR
MGDMNELDELRQKLSAARLRIEEMERGQARYQSLFENAPISLWEEDCSEVKRFIDELRRRGVEDLRRHFEANPGDVTRAAQLARVIEVNRATMHMYGAESKEALLAALNVTFTEDTLTAFREELIAFAEGKSLFQGEVLTRRLDGSTNRVLLSVLIPAGYEQTWERIFVAIVDITGRTEMEEARRRNEVQEELIRAQRAALSALASPVIPITDDILVMPLIGVLDSQRMDQIMGVLLQEVGRRQVKTAIIDITGVATVDSAVADMLVRMSKAVRLLGARVVLTGIRPEVAEVLAALDVSLDGIVTHGTLQAGIADATRRQR